MDTEPITKLKDNILRVLKSNPSGVTQKTFEEQIPDLKAEQLLVIITQLIKSSQIELVKVKNSKESLFKLRSPEIINLEKKLKSDEKAVYQLIRDADSKGVSAQVLKKNTKMKESDLLRVEKRLVEIGLARVLSFNGQKVFVAIDIAPDGNLSDKLFVTSERELDEARVADLEALIIDFLRLHHERAAGAAARVYEQRRAAFVTLEAVMQFLRTDARTERAISDKEVQAILAGLACASRIVRASQASLVKQQFSLQCDRDTDDIDNADSKITNFVYRFKPQSTQKAPSVAVFPCVLCPYKEYCCPGKEISPEKCKYLHDFLYEF